MPDIKRRMGASWSLGVSASFQGHRGRMVDAAPWSGLRTANRALPGTRPLVWLVVGLVLLVGSLPVLAQGAGVIEGQVVNGTSGGEAVGAGVTVTLQALQNDTLVETYETVTESGGGFRFEQLDIDPALQYWPETIYLDQAYSVVEPVQFDGDQTQMDVAITVYETTEDDDAISLDSVHLIAESFGEVLRVTEIHLYGNSGDRTYVGRANDAAHGLRTTVEIPLPESGVGLALEQDEAEPRFIEVEGGVVDTDPVRPGSETSLVFFSYHLMVMGDTVPLDRRFSYPVTGMNALAAQPDLSLRSEQLEAIGSQSFQDRDYAFYVGDGLAADAPLAIEFLPAAGEGMAAAMPSGGEAAGQTVTTESTRGNQELLRGLGFAVVGLAAIGAVVYVLSTVRQPSAPEDAPSVADTAASRKLVSELADLEEAFEAGQLDDDDYERRRAVLVELLKTLQH